MVKPAVQPQLKTVKPTPTAGQQLSFQAVLETWAEGMDYCAVHVPAAITEALGTRGPVLVIAQVNDSATFQVSLFPVGGGRHCIRIKAQVRKATRTQVGDLIRVRFTVLDRVAVEVPADLMSALQAAGLAAAFQSLPPGQQNFAIRRIGEAARPQTRLKRIGEALQAAQDQPASSRCLRPST
jgi:hypothetical protein